MRFAPLSSVSSRPGQPREHRASDGSDPSLRQRQVPSRHEVGPYEKSDSSSRMARSTRVYSVSSASSFAPASAGIASRQCRSSAWQCSARTLAPRLAELPLSACAAISIARRVAVRQRLPQAGHACGRISQVQLEDPPGNVASQSSPHLSQSRDRFCFQNRLGYRLSRCHGHLLRPRGPEPTTPILPPVQSVLEGLPGHGLRACPPSSILSILSTRD